MHLLRSMPYTTIYGSCCISVKEHISHADEFLWYYPRFVLLPYPSHSIHPLFNQDKSFTVYIFFSLQPISQWPLERFPAACCVQATCICRGLTNLSWGGTKNMQARSCLGCTTCICPGLTNLSCPYSVPRCKSSFTQMYGYDSSSLSNSIFILRTWTKYSKFFRIMHTIESTIYKSICVSHPLLWMATTVILALVHPTTVFYWHV
jgi:hypothetical protein